MRRDNRKGSIMKKFLKTVFATVLMAEILAGSSNAATVNLTTSDTSKASGNVYVKGATFSGSNASTSAHSVRFYSQYKNSAGDYANDKNCKVIAGSKIFLIP